MNPGAALQPSDMWFACSYTELDPSHHKIAIYLLNSLPCHDWEHAALYCSIKISYRRTWLNESIYSDRIISIILIVLKIHVFLNTAKIWCWCPISWQEKNHFKRRPKHITNKMSHWTLRWRWQWAIWDTIRRINKTPQNKSQTNSPNHPKSKSKCSL